MGDNSFLIRLGIDTANLSAGLSKTNKLLTGFETQTKALSRNIAAGLGFYGLSQAVTQTVSSMAHFEQSMSQVRAITGASGKDFDQLRNNAVQLAGAFKAIDISRMEVELGRLGFTTKEIINTTEASVNLAIAAGEDLGKSADTLGSVLRAFGLDTAESARVADVMAGAFNRSALSLENYTESIKYVAPVARAAGVSLEETTAMLGVLADNGIRGSMAGTSLRKILTDISRDGRPVSERLQELSANGITLKDAFDEVGRTAQTSLLILGNNLTPIKNLGEQLKHTAGEAKAMADVMENNLIGDWNKLVAAWDAGAQKGTGIISVLRLMTQATTDLFKSMSGQEGGLVSGYEDGFWKGIGNALGIDTTGASMPNTFKVTGRDEMPAGPPNERIFDISPDQFKPKKKKTQAFGGSNTDMDILTTGWLSEMERAPVVLQQVTTDLSLMGQEYQDVVTSQDLLNDGYKMLNEETAPEVQATVDGIIEKYRKMKDTQDRATKGMKDMVVVARNLAVQVGSQLSDAMAGAIAGTQDLATSMASVAEGLINELERLALAYIVAAAAKDAFSNPIGLIASLAGAVAGFGLVKSLFAQARGSGGGSMGGEGRPIAVANNSQNYSLRTRVRGTDLEIIMDRNNDQNSFTRPT